MKKVNVLVLVLAVFLAVGCNKDDSTATPVTPGPSNPTGQKCKVVTMASDKGGYNYRVNYIYDSQARIIQEVQVINGVADSLYRKTIEYNPAGQISRINQYRNGKPDAFSTYLYNTESLVSQQDEFFIDNSSGVQQTIHSRRSTFEYASDKKLTTAYLRNMYDNRVSYTRYTYPSLNTAKGEIGSVNPDGTFDSAFYKDEYKFDDKKHPHQLLGVIAGAGFISGNNILFFKRTTVHLSKQDSATFTYEYNAAGFPTKIKEAYNAFQPVNTTYTYNCQ